VALLGGYRASGRLRVGERIVRVAAVGGMNLDLTAAEFSAPRLTIVKVSLVGGLKLRVPAGARVSVHGFAIGGRAVEEGRGEEGGEGPEIVVHSWGIIGGTKIRRA
jgi:hypothetical protein